MQHPIRPRPPITVLCLLLVTSGAAAATEIPPPLQDLYESVRPSVVRVVARGSAGSGFVVGDGMVATAWHVVSGGREMVVETAAGQVVPARVHAFDRDNDLALLAVEGALEGAPPLTLAETDLRVGDPLLAVGHPLLVGQGPEGRRRGLLAWSLTEGIVSALSEGFVQTTASLQPGNSGCPVLDRQGRVVGVAIERRGDFGVFTRVGALVALMEQLEARPPRRPVRPSLGLHLRLAGLPAAPEERRSYGGIGGDIQMIVVDRLLIAVRAHQDWLLPGMETRRGRPGRLREVLFQVGGSFPTPFDPRESLWLEAQPYGFVGAVALSSGSVHDTFEIVDPGCDPANEACAYLEGEDASWSSSLHLLVGGGFRISLAALFLGIEVGLAPDAPAETFRVTGSVGLRLGRP